MSKESPVKVGLEVNIPENVELDEPITIYDSKGMIYGLFIERYNAHLRLPEDSESPQWHKVPGFYVLLSSPNENNKINAYVGKTDTSFRGRINEHLETKDYWSYIVIFINGSRKPFDGIETDYLEGAMHSELSSDKNIIIHNKKPTGVRGKEHLPSGFIPRMQDIIKASLRILALRGYRINAPMPLINNLSEELIVAPKTLNNIQSSKVKPILPALPPLPLLSERDTFRDKQKTHVLILSDEELFLKIKRITEEIKLTPKRGVSRYGDWAAPDIINNIISTRPQNFEQLDKIKGVGKNFESRYGDIIRLFNPSYIDEKI
jgi:hypothetical protein